MSETPHLRLQNLSAGYGPPRNLRPVIEAIHLEAKGSQFIALLGPNGSGKSTLLKSVAGLITPIQGEVILATQTLHSLSPKARARQLAFLAQHREAMPLMTTGDIIRLGRAPYRGTLGTLSAEGETHVTRALHVTQTEALKTRAFGTLSGGEQARVLLARALAVNATLLLADEPIAALDPYYQLTMMDILQSEAKSGKLVIAALHDLALAQQFCDHIWVMDQGRLVQDAPSESALSEDVLRDVFNIRAPKSGFQHLQIS